MTQTFFSQSPAYQSYNDGYVLKMHQYPLGLPGFSLGYDDWKKNTSHPQHSEVYSYYPHWYHQKKLSHPRKKKSFTIRSILGLDNSDQENNDDCFSSVSLSPPRLTPEPVQMSASNYFENEEFPHRIETVTSSDSYMSNDPAICRLSPPSLEPQSSNSCRSSEEGLSPNKRTKRIRTMFTQYQLEKLEQEFERTQYMVGSARIQLASELNLTENQVKVWFQNRRIKLRKQFHEKQQAKLAKLKEIDSEDKQIESDSDNSHISSSCSSSEDSLLRRSA